LTAGSDSRVLVGGRSVEVRDLPGEEPALLLMHEGLGSVGLWRSFPAELAQGTGRRVVAFSRFGHGASDPPPEPRTPAFMHAEARGVVPELIDALELDSPVLVGHSDGASIALIYAAEHDCRAVVAIAPHVFVEEICLAEIRLARESYVDGDLRSRLARYHRDPDAAFFGWNDVWLHPSFPEWDLRGLLAGIRCPLLLIQGIREQYGTLAQLDAIEQSVAGGATVSRVELDCRHSPPTELPEETVAAIRAFLISA
jgi:pimeloyl-ACP methyl ester carboxylesterase